MRAVGSIVGRFRIDKLLFRNAVTSLYRATDQVNNTTVALKLVNNEQAGNESVQERLLAEGSVASLLNHPHIVSLLEVGKTEGQAYISMELITQPTLAQTLRQHGRLPAPRALAIARDIAMALQYAHDLGLVHRDIKPGNIFTAEHDTPARLGDFGIALSPTSPGVDRTRGAPDAYATPRYMSPEQATGADVDARSDQYSLGVVLFEMLTGQVPHEGSDLNTLVTQIASEPSPTLRSVEPNLSRSIEHIVLKLLQKKPQKRFADCTELVKALDDALADSINDSA